MLKNRDSVRLVLVLIALATAVSHFLFGVWYWRQWVNTEIKPGRSPLELRGEDYLRTFPGWGSPEERDSAAYNTTALSIMDSGVPRTRSGALHMHAPAFCYFLALCYKIGGVRIVSVALPQAILAGIACFLVGLTAGRILPSHPIAGPVVAALLYLLNLRAAMYVGYVYPTILVVVLAALAIAMADRLKKGPAIVVFVGAIALATFAQAAFFAVACGAAAWLLLQSRRERSIAQLLGGIAIIAVVALKIVATTVGGTKDDFQQNDREIFWKANNPLFEGLRLTDHWEDRLGNNPWTSWHASEHERQRFDSYLARAGGDGQRAFLLWTRENPGQYLKLCVIRFRTALGPFTGQMSPRNRKISTVIWLLLFPAGCYGLWILRRHPTAQFVLFACAGYAGLATFLNEDWYLRFRLPIEAMLAVFAAAGYTQWMESRRSSLTGDGSPPQANAR